MLNSAEVCRRLGITYRMLDYWARSGIVRPRGGHGTGHPRRFDEADVRALALAASLMRLGAGTEVAGMVAGHWQDQPEEHWAGWLVVQPDGSHGVNMAFEGAAWVVDLDRCAGRTRRLVAV